MRQILIFLYGAWRFLLLGFLVLIIAAQFVPERVFQDYFRDPAVVDFLDEVEPFLEPSSGDSEIALFKETFSDAFDRIMEEHVDPPDATTLIDAAWVGIQSRPAARENLTPADATEFAISAMLAVLNTRSSYGDADYVAARQRWNESESYSGIGASVVWRNGLPQIHYVHPETPADRAGIRQGDRLVAIDGQAVQAMTREEVVDRLRGDVDTDVIVAVRRENRADFDVSIRRQRVQHQAVQVIMVDSIGYFRLSNIGDSTSGRFGESLAQLQQQTAPALDGIVLDLRVISGGALEDVVPIADLFLDEGLLIASTEGRSDMAHTRHESVSTERAAGIPVVVLVGRETADVAQVLAGALQAHGRAWMLGAPTLGGAYVYSSSWLPNGAAVWITTSRIHTPRGVPLDQIGIEPDLYIASEPETAPPHGRYVDARRCPQRFGGSDRSIDCAIAVIEAGGIGRFLGELDN